MKDIFLIVLICAISLLSVNAQALSGRKRPQVIESIESSSKVVIKQDLKLDKLIEDYLNKKDALSGPYIGAGYRVQVFSSNAQRTAKDESLNIERRLRTAFPNHGVYRIYASPFWKVRIGDFRTHEDAQAFLTELIKLFPELKKDTYTVRESKVTIR